MSGADGTPPLRNAYVGSPVERVEDLRFLRGRGQYVDDLAREGLLHAAILRSAVAHGRLRSVDASAARALPGVHAVITAAEIGFPVPNIPLRLWPLPQLEHFEQPVIAETKVRYVGEPVAVVVADSAALAEDALEAIAVDVEALPPVTDRRVAAAGESLVVEAHGGNLAITYTATKGDADAAFRDAPYVRRERLSVQRHMALPMEPRGLLAEWDEAAGRLTLSGAAKVPFFNRRILAKLLGLPEEAVELIENDVGGGFGARGEFFPEDFLIPFAARHVGRPVKWTEDRREHLLTMSHAREMDCEIELACRRDGTILGLRGQVFVDVGAYFKTNGTVSPRNVAQFLSGPYRIPNIRLDSLCLLTNKAPIGTYRGPGRFEADFFRERLFDLAAGELGIDRVEFRRRNLVAEHEMPYPIATIGPPEKKEEFDSGDYHAVLDRCLQEFGWAEKAKLQGGPVDGRHHGLGIGCFIEGGAAGPRESARLVVEADGDVTVYVGSAAVGQGLETILGQIAADALELPMERIRVLHGSTSYVKEGFGSYHSRSTVMGGSAILLAAEMLREALRAAAAARLGCAAPDISLADGRAIAPDGRSIGWGELAGESGLAVEESFANHRHTYAYGTAAAHVAVDPKTGHIEIVDFLIVEDVGRIVNPLTVRGQAIGSVVQGLGGTILEHLVYDENGQLLTGSLADYLIPSATDFPNVRAIMLQLKPSPINPLGVKGAGEGGTIPAGGVVANAVAAALKPFGVEPRALPLTPSALWHLIDAARRAPQAEGGR
jgi:aerobic carbon-monoxide dehydrogenase large subunit